MDLTEFKKTFDQKCRINAESRFLIGVSGGVDSVVLLDLMAKIGYDLVIGHFNHQLRPSAAREAEFVADLAESYHYPFCAATANVAELSAASGSGVEEEARKQRYQFLFRESHKYGCQGVLVAHHADDQVETVLMHLLRGAGSDGLSGMKYRTVNNLWDKDIPLLRPLLAIWRSEVEEYARTNSLVFVNDESNQDTHYLRNRIRHEVIPLLDTIKPGFKNRVLRSADVLAGDGEIISEVLQKDWEECFEQPDDDVFIFNYEQIKLLPSSRQRNLIRAILLRIDPEQRDFGYEMVNKIQLFLDEPYESKVIPIGSDKIFGIHHNLLFCGSLSKIVKMLCRMYPQWPGESSNLTLEENGQIGLAEGGKLTWDIHQALDKLTDVRNVKQFDETEAWMDLDTVIAGLRLRHFEAGDRLEPFGMPGHTIKISDLLINQKVAAEARSHYLLLESDAGVCWVPGLRMAHYCRITNETQRIIHFVWENQTI